MNITNSNEYNNEARPSVVICSFYEPEQLGSVGGAFSLTAASASLPVHQLQSVSSRAQDSSFQAGLSLTFPLRTTKEIELNWTELKHVSGNCRHDAAVRIIAEQPSVSGADSKLGLTMA